MQNKKNTQEKQWILLSDEAADPQQAAAIVNAMAAELGLHTVTAQLLYNRGCRSTAEAKAFLSMESEMFGDPFSMQDMEKAVARIRRAVQAGEHITIFGDYYVDGVTSVCVLYLYLKSKGACVDYYIPNREGEGYGMSCAAMDVLAKRGTQLIVTVDTGITADDEIVYAAGCGMDVVVTDHHECRPTLPQAVAVVNPHRPDCPYPYKELAGVGVIFRCMCAYEEHDTGRPQMACFAELCRRYADLVAIGTIADVMPLTGENKLIVSYGLKMIAHTERVGLRALVEATFARPDGTFTPFEKLSAKITSSYVGFTLAPRINAAGRIKTAALAAELFLSDSYEQACETAEALCEANRLRQEEENHIMEEAYAKIEREHDVSRDRVIVLDADTWHHGVIGIVASRITERYGLPCILISFKGSVGETAADEDVGKGSGRSVPGINLVDALAHCADKLVKYGGHELAAGLSVCRGQLADFRREINAYVGDLLHGEPPSAPTVAAEMQLTFSQLTLPLVRELHLLEPFGTGNPMPLFVIQNAFVLECTGVRQGKHTRLVIGEGSMRITAMCFSRSPEDLGVCVGDCVSLLFQLDENEWNGRTSVQLIVRDVHGGSAQKGDPYSRDRARFDAIMQGAAFTEEEHFIPCRDDCADVYRHITNVVRTGRTKISVSEILSGLSVAARERIGYVKLRLILLIFIEMNLLGASELQPEVYAFKIVYKQNKVDLEKSHLLRRLRSQQRG